MSNVLKGATAGVLFFAWVFSCAGVGANWQVGTTTLASSSLFPDAKKVASTSLWKVSSCTKNSPTGEVDSCTSIELNDFIEHAEKSVEDECAADIFDDLSSEECEDKAKEGLNKEKARLNTARAFGIMVALLGLPTLALSVMGIGKGIPGAILSFMCSLFCVIAVGVVTCSSEDQFTNNNCLFGPFKTKETEYLTIVSITHVAGGAGFALEILAMILFFIGAILAVLVGRSQDAGAADGAKDTPGIHGLPTEEVKNPGNPTNAAGLNNEL
jgi:hypothetical protein